MKNSEVTFKDNASKNKRITRLRIMREIFLTARADETMPQKSTYFYPKVYSGLVINKIER